MAKILIPEDGATRHRNFDEIIVLGRSGQVRKVVKQPDDLVLTVVGKSRKLVFWPRSHQQRFGPTWFGPVFYLLLGIWITNLIHFLL